MRQHRVLLVFLLAVFLLPTLSLSAAKAPTISGITHASSGSLIYTIWGTGFQKGAKLLIGGLKPVSTWQGGTQFIVFQPPLNKTGTVDVQITNPDGTKILKKGGFTFPAATAVQPIIRGVAPNQGSTVLKTVWGSNFDQGAKVYVNGVLAPAQWQVGTQYIVFQPPAGTNGTVTVEVRNQNGGRISKSVDLAVVATGSGTYAYETPATYTYQTPTGSNGPGGGTGTIFGGGWTWMGGSQGTYTGGVYGTRGVAAPGNFPGARNEFISWTGTDGNLWLFGGFGMGASGAAGLDDVWKYDVGNKQWTWMYGSTGGNVAPNYGTRGVPSASNTPGSRANEVKWKDSSGAIWIFGGVAGSDDEFSWRNDLWKFDPSSGMWTWMSGTPNIKSGGVCGTRGVPSPNNVPGGRVLATSWIDSSDNLWLMGGWAYDCGGDQMIGNDLWKYSPSTNQWVWMGGSNTDAVYGSKGVPSSNNIPAARQQGMAWTDPAGNFWLFGGFGHNGTFAYPINGYGAYSDFWRYQPSSGQWTWMGGSQTGDAAGTYGTLGTPSPSNMPGARRSGGAVVDNQGNLWLFGGMGAHDSSGNTGGLNDLWKYQPSTGIWTWVSGSNGLNAPSTFGTQGIAGSGNAPGLRTSGGYWTDGNGQIWVFGGEPFANSHNGILNDLWVFNPNTAAVSNPISQPVQTPTTPIQSQPITSTNPAKVICRFPVGDAQWNECINYAPRGSIIFPQYVTDGHDAIITDSLQPVAGLTQHIQSAVAAGMKVIGYVNAKYDTGQKDANDNEIYLVKSDDVARSEINIWFKIPGISGIYFGAGGALDQTSINHFNMLADYIHGKGGIAIMHGDEGGDTDKQLISHFDVLVTAEAYVHYDGTGTLMNDFFGNPVFNNTARTWMANYPRSKFAAFSNLMAKDANGNYIYVGGSSPAELALLKRAEQDFLNYGNGYLFLLDTETGPQTNFQAEDLNYWKTFDDGLDGSFDGVLPQ